MTPDPRTDHDLHKGAYNTCSTWAVLRQYSTPAEA